jgi:DtxR family Mn-dependent transcriptional regulator
MTSSSRLSRSVEDYLKAVFTITEREETAATSALAHLLDVQPASVTGMVKRMAESGLLEHVPYRGVRLTRRGEKEALRVIRRHRILETYLVDRLGYSWDNVHAEAERLEHAASEELIERMASRLEYPSHDPHGAPIPTRAGEIEETRFESLAEADPGQHLCIRSVSDEDSEGLRQFEARGLVPGALLHVEKCEAGGVSVRIVGKEEVTHLVGQDLATRIFVSAVERTERG